MAFDPSPTTWLGAGYSLASSVAGFNTDTAGSDKLLLQLTDALADPTTGDIRSVMMATCEAFFQAWTAVATPDRPDKMVISRTTSGGASSTTFTYNLRFTVDATSIVVVNE